MVENDYCKQFGWKLYKNGQYEMVIVNESVRNWYFHRDIKYGYASGYVGQINQQQIWL